MKEKPIIRSPYAFDPFKHMLMTETERNELYSGRVDQFKQPYTVIDVLQKVYHRDFRDDFTGYIKKCPHILDGINAEQAFNQMRLVYEQFAKDKYTTPLPLMGKGSVKAIHYIMSFADEENVTPELAHKIAKAFVRKNFGDDAQAVIATHVDKLHTHCHIILNSYSLSGQKYYANRTTLRQARETENGVYRAFGFTPALNFENKGRSVSYYEWSQNKKGTSWKEQIRNEIDSLIGIVNSLDELLQVLEERGYEIKRGKYISIKAPEQQRFVRTKTLGQEYTEESLKTRILYREVGAGTMPELDSNSQLRAAYVAVLGDVRILAEQREKVQRKRILSAEYSADNDLDVYKLSAQLSVINKDRIASIGDLEGRINRLKSDYEKQRQEINNYIEEHNRLISLWERHSFTKSYQLRIIYLPPSNYRLLFAGRLWTAAIFTRLQILTVCGNTLKI